MNPYRENAVEDKEESPWPERIYVGIFLLSLGGLTFLSGAAYSATKAYERGVKFQQGLTAVQAPACHDSIYTAIENHKLECPHASQTLGLLDGNIVCRCGREK